MKILKSIIVLLFLLTLSCGMETKMGIDFDEIKSEMSLTEDQETEFDIIVDKYTVLRGEVFAAARKSENVDRVALMGKMRKIIEDQNNEVKNILKPEQFDTYITFVKKFSNRFNPPGYSKDLIQKINSELSLNDGQSTKLVAINKAFEKAYIDAHDYYHGNNEAAKEYWNKYNDERKKAVKALISEEQYAKYLELVSHVQFEGEHGGDKKE